MVTISNRAGIHPGVKLVASAEMSRDMAENRLLAFEGRSSDEVLNLEIRNFGVWVKDPNSGVTLFLGSMKPPAPQIENG